MSPEYHSQSDSQRDLSLDKRLSNIPFHECNENEGGNPCDCSSIAIISACATVIALLLMGAIYKLVNLIYWNYFDKASPAPLIPQLDGEESDESDELLIDSRAQAYSGHSTRPLQSLSQDGEPVRFPMRPTSRLIL